MILILVLLIITAIIVAILEYVFGVDRDSACSAALLIVGGLIVIVVWFYLFTAKGRAIVRAWNIKDIRKKRIDREFIESWRRANRNSISKEDLKLIREIDRMIENPNDDDMTGAAVSAAAYTQSHQSNGGN